MSPKTPAQASKRAPKTARKADQRSPRTSSRSSKGSARGRGHVRLPAGLAAVLDVLSSSAVVMDSDDRVLQASDAARAFGLVSGNELVVGELQALTR